jgi:transposase
MKTANEKAKVSPTSKRVKITRCKLTKKQQSRMLEFFVLGVTARSAADLIGIQPNTAALFYRKLREVIAHYLSQEAKDALSGDFVFDESSVSQINKEKIPVFGMLALNGKVFTKMTGKVDVALITSGTPNVITPNSVVFSDTQNQDKTLDVNECHKENINASEKVNQAKLSIDDTENFWSETKDILRKYNGVPKNSFPLFLKECEFRFNYNTPKEQLKALKLWTGLK